MPSTSGIAPMDLSRAFNATTTATTKANGAGLPKRKTAKRSVAAVTQSKYITRKQAASLIQRAFRAKCENKVHFNSAQEASLSTIAQGASTQWYPLLAPVAGVSAGARVGNEIIAENLDIIGHLQNNASQVNYVRMVVFWYMNDNSTSASGPASDIFQFGVAGAADFATVFGMQSMYAPLNTNKVQVLYDQVHKLAKSAEPSGNDTKMFKIKRSLRSKRVNFNIGSSSVGTDVADKTLMLLAWAAEAPDDTGAGTTVELSFISRGWYTDP